MTCSDTAVKITTRTGEGNLPCHVSSLLTTTKGSVLGLGLKGSRLDLG